MIFTRRYRFCASHRLHLDSLGEEENRELFGKCNNPYGHGHDYVLEISVEGEPDRSGQIVRRQAIDALMNEKILPRIDHRNLNMDVPELASRIPTTENLAMAIREMLDRDWPLTAKLARVRVAETDRNIFELETR